MKLIEEFMWAFRKLSVGERWNFIRNMGCNEEVFSIGISNFTPQLRGKEVYLYAHKKEAVILWVDNYPSTDEVADEELFGEKELPLYYSESAHRISPVYLLREARQAYCESFLSRKLKAPEVLCVLLTTSSIANKEDVAGKWDDKSVIVWDGLVRADFHIPTTGNLLMKEARHLRRYQADLAQGKCSFAVDDSDTIPYGRWLKRELALRLRAAKEESGEDGE